MAPPPIPQGRLLPVLAGGGPGGSRKWFQKTQWGGEGKPAEALAACGVFQNQAGGGSSKPAALTFPLVNTEACIGHLLLRLQPPPHGVGSDNGHLFHSGLRSAAGLAGPGWSRAMSDGAGSLCSSHGPAWVWPWQDPHRWKCARPPEAWAPDLQPVIAT